MYSLALTKQAASVAQSLSASQHAELNEILDVLSDHLAPLQASGLVRQSTTFGQKSFRYYDELFPYLIYFQLGSATFGYTMDVLLVTLILAAPPQPTQARV